MERRRLWFFLSALLLVPGIVSLIIWQLKLGIDFKGGSLTEYSYESDKVEEGSEEVKKVYEEEGLHEIKIDTNTQNGELRIYVKSESIPSDKHSNIVRRLSEVNPPFKELSFETIDPQVGADVTQKALLALVIASFAIIAYISLSFRGVPLPATSWQFGIFAVVALLHDAIFILGFYSLMGHFAGWEVKTEFVTAVLTVMGFSVHDTIVVFDRLRENLRKYPGHSFRQVTNISVAQTMSRSIITSLLVVLPLFAFVLFGGESTRHFAITLIVGIVTGTYSSIFVATPLLDWWHDNGKHFLRFLRRLKPKLPRRAQLRTKTA